MTWRRELVGAPWGWLEGDAPLPLMLVLEPWMNGLPWSSAVRTATSVVQTGYATLRPDDPGVCASLALAVRVQRVESVVLCWEGPDPAALPWESPINVAARSLMAAMRALSGEIDDVPRLKLLRCDPTAGGCQVFVMPDYAGAWSAVPSPSWSLSRLVRRLEDVT
jgi:hypothetical protein